MKRIEKPHLLGICGALLISLSLAALFAGRADSAPAPPFSSAAAQSYGAHGRGTMTVDGPGCCDGVVFPGTFEMNYQVDSLGHVNISRLYTTLADMDVTFHFLIFETGRVQMRCGTARNDADIVGNVDASGNLTIASGAASLSGNSYEKRDPGGNCGGNVSAITLNNNAPLTGVLDPASNRISFAGVFSATTEGNTYTVRLDMTGDYLNRPPIAVFGVEGPGLERFSQGGCPAVLNHGNPPEPTVEANNPAGLKMYLKSFSGDPDGAWQGGDLQLDQWFHGRDATPLKFIGESRRLGPLVFEFGPIHHLELQTTDRAGALSSSDCDFRVVDTTPPSVTPPASTTITESIPGGATPSTSQALKNFLASAAATDVVTTSPTSLPPLFNGKEIKPDTVFPTGSSSEVQFRFADAVGNVGTASSWIKVIASKK